jgi:hypothetical protein
MGGAFFFVYMLGGYVDVLGKIRKSSWIAEIATRKLTALYIYVSHLG